MHTLYREHGLHPAKESGKKVGSELENHSLLEGSRRDKGETRRRSGGGQPRRRERVKPTVEPEGANAAFREWGSALRRGCRAPDRGST